MWIRRGLIGLVAILVVGSLAIGHLVLQSAIVRAAPLGTVSAAGADGIALTMADVRAEGWDFITDTPHERWTEVADDGVELAAYWFPEQPTTAPQAAGQRHLACSEGFMWFSDMAGVLQSPAGRGGLAGQYQRDAGLLLRIMARFAPALREAVPQLGVVGRVDNVKARRDLGWQPRSREEVIASTGRAIIDLDLVTA